jgi:hypothetical protein
MLFDVMEQAASRAVVKRSLFGPVRVSVLRRENVLCTGEQSDTKKKPEEVVVGLVQSGMVREGQVLQAMLPGPIVCRHRSIRRGPPIVPKPPTVVTFTVLSIERFGKSRYHGTVVVG